MRFSRRLLLAAPAAQLLSRGLSAQPSPPLIPPAQLDDDLEIQGDPIEAARRRARLFIDVRVNGEGPFRFLVDSGADRSVVGAALASRLALPVAGRATLQSLAGPSEVQTVHVSQLALGASLSENLTLPALPEAWLGADGLIGIDALAESRLLLDYERRSVTVQDSRTTPPRSDDEIVVTARRRKGQLILAEVRLQSQRLYAVIDSGAEMSVGNLALASRLLGRRQKAEMRRVELIAVTGERLAADMAIISRLEIGRFTIQNLAIAFVDAAPFTLFGLADQPALLLGSDALQSFRRIALDFGRRRVRFTLRR
ncbi:aspartyl protease family protein [Polymorphobacter sp.]|uniref:aspartyl protease family protein n=1 Tax=Polymorphobacter sp. TaxID=1909290 RepID=UPI003F6EDC2B